jgi:hypothetical protein
MEPDCNRPLRESQILIGGIITRILSFGVMKYVPAHTETRQ